MEGMQSLIRATSRVLDKASRGEPISEQVQREMYDRFYHLVNAENTVLEVGSMTHDYNLGIEMMKFFGNPDWTKAGLYKAMADYALGASSNELRGYYEYRKKSEGGAQ